MNIKAIFTKCNINVKSLSGNSHRFSVFGESLLQLKGQLIKPMLHLDSSYKHKNYKIPSTNVITLSDIVNITN